MQRSPLAKRSPINRTSPLNAIKSKLQRDSIISDLPSTNNYAARRQTLMTATKSPRDFREMWRRPDNEVEESSSDSDCVTNVL